ncbi:MAG: anti-sigma factor [Bacteroidetes bacterium]|nr:anti-sigma factor [Bacteroidota bacterium]
MDIKEYIASGVVELYAMGSLSPEEKKEFEQKMLVYPEVAAELKNVQETLEVYSQNSIRNPRPALRSSILSKVYNQASESPEKSKLKSLDPSHRLTYKYLIAASLAALLISTFASWFFYKSWNDAEDRYVSVMKEKNQIALNYNVIKNTFDHTYSDLMMMRDENAKVSMLMPIDSTKHFQARVYWNKYTQETYIDILALPAPDSGKQYQLWAMAGGLPIDAGVVGMQMEDDGMQRMKNIPIAEQWAITLEPSGGNISPTMDQLVLFSSSN